MSTQANIIEVAQSFASIAQEFCSAVESAANLDNIELLKRLYKILPSLINEAICLPNVELNDDQLIEGESEQQARRKAQLTGAQWRELYESLRAKLANLDLYWQVFDPTKDNEAIHGSLADDFADIYRDLKEELVLNEIHQASPEQNIWHWRLGYYSHWGKHAIDALRTMHFVLEGLV